MIKTLLTGFLLMTSFLAMATSVSAMIALKKESKQNPDDDTIPYKFAAVVALWMVSGLFLFFAYLAS